MASFSHLPFSFCLVHTHEIGKVLKKESKRSKNVSFFLSLLTAYQASCFRVSETGGAGGRGPAAD